ncbi:MAG: hypothetical protein QOF03_985 [Alphaproteobacteria bacterium]|nr:hypothetical protein [Alphaproteobacteria bacterium]
MLGADPHISHNEVNEALHLEGELVSLIPNKERKFFLELLDRVRQPKTPWMNFPSGRLCSPSAETRNRVAVIFLLLCFSVAPQFEWLLADSSARLTDN